MKYYAMAAALQALSAAVFLFMLVPRASMAASTLLQDKCAFYADDDRTSYNYCVRTLQADRASAIAARIARATAKATAYKISKLQVAEKVPARLDGLAICAAEYAAAVRRLGRAAKDAASGGAPELQEALTLLGEVTGAPERCQEAFEAVAGRQGSLPMNSADWELDDIVGVAIVIMPRKPTASTRA
ncbi:hypothetical protein ABZP36_000686 [Zizania latifolia]